MIAVVIDEMRTEGQAVNSICRALYEQGYAVAARTQRAWASTRTPGRGAHDRGYAVIEQLCDPGRSADHACVRQRRQRVSGRPMLTSRR
jgi:putative transposase